MIDPAMGIKEPCHAQCRCHERGEPCRCRERGEPCKCIPPREEKEPVRQVGEPRTRRSVLMTLDPATDLNGTVQLQRWDKKKPWLRTGCERIGARP
jgi:hypothetical protein